MSSDNFILIRKHGDKFYVTDESASSDEASRLPNKWAKAFDNLEAARDYAFDQYAEYGVSERIR